MYSHTTLFYYMYLYYTFSSADLTACSPSQASGLPSRSVHFKFSLTPRSTALHTTMHGQEHLLFTHPNQYVDLYITRKLTSCKPSSIIQTFLCNPEICHGLLNYPDASVLARPELINFSSPFLSLLEGFVESDSINELLGII